MKRVFATSILALFIFGSAMAADIVKYTFPGVAYTDGRVGTIQVNSKTSRKTTVTTCSYFSDPNDQYLGQYQSDEFASKNADEVKQFCIDHYDERQP